MLISASTEETFMGGRHLGQARADAELLHQGIRECGEATVLGDIGAHDCYLAGWLLHAITALSERSFSAQASPGSPSPCGALPKVALPKICQYIFAM